MAPADGGFIANLPQWILVGLAAIAFVSLPGLRDGGFFLPQSIQMANDEGVVFHVSRDGVPRDTAKTASLKTPLKAGAPSAKKEGKCAEQQISATPFCPYVPAQDLSPAGRSPFVFRFQGLGQLPNFCYGPAVLSLISGNNADPVMAQAFFIALQRIAGMNIYGYPALNNLWDMYNFFQFDVANWIPMENMNLTHMVAGKSMYIRLSQHYFIFNQPELLPYQTTLKPHQAGQMGNLSVWMRTFDNEWAAFLRSAPSFPAEAYEAILQSQAFFMDEYVIPNPTSPNGGFTSYNDWFARHVKPGERPIDSPNNDSVVVTPCDSTFVGAWPIDEDGCIGLTDHEINNATTVSSAGLWKQAQLPKLRGLKARLAKTHGAAVCALKNKKAVPSVKGITYYSAQTLIRDAIAQMPGVLETAFNGGTFLHMFLNVYDYHRLHLPTRGFLWYNNFTSENVYLNVTSIPEGQDPYVPHVTSGQTGLQYEDSMAFFGVSSTEFNQVDAEDYTGYQFYQSRGVAISSTPIGWVATIPMGMAQVSMVTPTAQPGSNMNKGDEFSAFGMGGSDMVVLFQKQANVKVTWEKNAAGQYEHKLQGEAFATATPFNTAAMKNAHHLKKGRRSFRGGKKSE